MVLPVVLVLLPIIKPVLGKYVIGHMATALAHAPAHAVATFAHQAGTNALVAAGNAGTAAAAVKILWSAGKSGNKLANKVMDIKTKEQLRAFLHDKSLSDDEKADALVWAVTVAVAQKHYAKMRHKSSSGSEYKTELRQIELCDERENGQRCKCPDFRPGFFDKKKCHCTHSPRSHRRITAAELADPKSLEHIFWKLAQDVYPSFNHIEATGWPKEIPSDSSGCSKCPCVDFNWKKGAGVFSKRCWCGHKDSEHPNDGDYSWIIGIVVADVIERSNLANLLA